MRKLYSFLVLMLASVLSYAQAVDVTPARYVFADQPAGQYTLDYAGQANPPANLAAAVDKFNNGFVAIGNGQMTTLEAAQTVALQKGLSIADLGGNIGKVLAIKGQNSTYVPGVTATTEGLNVGWYNLSLYMAPETVAVDETVRFQVVFKVFGAITMTPDAYTYENNNKGGLAGYKSVADEDTWQQVEFDYSASNASNLPLRLALKFTGDDHASTVLIRSIKMTKSPEGDPETKTLSATTDFKQEPAAPAYKKVRLQFSETNANGTTVSVVDENGEVIEGASATLENIQKQDGSNAPVGTTLQTYNAHLLCPVYTNAPNNGWVLTFKLNGLQGQFNKALVDLHALTAGGAYQSDANIKYWTANLSTGTDLENLADFGTSERYGISDPQYQDGSTRHVEALVPGTVTEFTNDMYVKLHVVKVEGGGCFCGIQYIDFPMYNPEAKFTTITWNLMDGELVKASEIHTDCEEGTTVNCEFNYPFLNIEGETSVVAGKEDQTINLTYTENYPFTVTTDPEHPVYGKLHAQSNQNHYIYLTEEGFGKATTADEEAQEIEFTDSYMWYFTGNCFDGFQLWNKAFPGQPLKATTPIASVSEESEAGSSWTLRSGNAGSQFTEVSYFCLWQEGVDYLNCNKDLKYWSANDAGSTFYFEEVKEPEPEPFTVTYDPATTLIMITPADMEATYFWCVANDAVIAILGYDDKFDWFDNYMIPWAWADDVVSGTDYMTVEEYEDYWQYGLYDGTNYVMICPANATEDGEYGGAERTGEIYVYEITIGNPTGVNTVLKHEASKAAYNLQGKLVKKLERGINIMNGKKVIVK